MKRSLSRPVPAIAFSCGAAAINLPVHEAATIRSLCKYNEVSTDHVSTFLNKLQINNADFCQAVFALANSDARGAVPVENVLTTYAVLRRLAFEKGDTGKAAAQEAVWLAFIAAAGGSDADSITWEQWHQFQSTLGGCVGGLQSFPCEESATAMRKVWKKARPRFRENLTFDKFVNVLRVYDAGLLTCLRAMGFVLACKVIDASRGNARKPIWDRETDDTFLGPYLTHSIEEALRKKVPAPAIVVDAEDEEPEEARQNTVHITSPTVPRLQVSFGDEIENIPASSSDDKSPISVLPKPPKTADTVRRSKKTGKTPFHIDYSALELGEKIGAGGYGEVYKGSFLMSPVAVKVFHVNLQTAPTDIQDPSQLNRMSTICALQRFASVNSQAKYRNFVREVEMMSVVRHPNLVLYMGACGDPNTPLCIVSELFTGGSMFEYLHGMGEFRPSVKIALKFALHIARGMFYLHSSQPSILHRDLKSRNVLLSGRKDEQDGTPHVVICDFGLCQLFGEEGQSPTQMGTASYMSPDVINGEQYEAADDVFSYGILLHEIFTGRVPYEGMRAMQVMYQVANEGLRPKFGEVGVPMEVRRLIEDCWSSERSKRPGFDEVIRRLDAMGGGIRAGM